MSAEVAEVAGILATLSHAGVAVRVSRGRLVVRGATLNFTEAVQTLEGREDAVEKALALNRPRQAKADTQRPGLPEIVSPGAYWRDISARKRAI